MANIVTIRVFISLTYANNWPLCQLDINNAFLHGYLDEEVYIYPPLGYDKAKFGEVCHLQDPYMVLSRPQYSETKS